MPIHVNNFMGRLGWTLRKRMPRLSSALYLKLQFLTRGGGQRAYTEWFLSQNPAPQPILSSREASPGPSSKLQTAFIITIGPQV